MLYHAYARELIITAGVISGMRRRDSATLFPYRNAWYKPTSYTYSAHDWRRRRIKVIHSHFLY